jgi:hypothetical protein
VEPVYLGDERSGAELLLPMRKLGPALDTVTTIPVEQLSSVHMDPEHPVPGAGDGMLLADFPEEAIDSLVAVAGADSGSPLLSVEVRHLEGELARARSGQGKGRSAGRLPVEPSDPGARDAAAESRLGERLRRLNAGATTDD